MPTFPTAQDVITAAASQVGTTELPPGSNVTPYGKAYGWNGVAWCGIFVWWSFNQAGIDLRKSSITDPQFTPYFFAEAKRAGWVVEADADIKPGDVLFFDFEPPFNTAGIQHTGIATASPSGGYVATVEGNTSSGQHGSQDNGGGVFQRTRSLEWVVAAVRPPYSKPLTVTITGPLHLGSTGSSVKAVQQFLGVTTDGDFGRITEVAVKNWQSRRGLNVDGVVGPQTAHRMGFEYATAQ